MLRALIIDDEPLAHEIILYHLDKHPDIDVVAQCLSAVEALNLLANESVDLLFLDINMPQLSGIELLKVLANKPQVIIISAYQEHAIAGFELDVTDYLLKPVAAERFAQALDKVRARANTSTPIVPEITHIVVKVDREKRRIALADITFLEAYGNYVKLWSATTMILVNSTLKQLIELLPLSQFTQVHKSHVVNNSKVIGIDTETLTMDCGQQVKISKTYKKAAQAIL